MIDREDLLFIFDVDGTILDNDGVKDSLFRQYFETAVEDENTRLSVANLLGSLKGMRRLEKFSIVTKYLSDNKISHRLTLESLDEFVDSRYFELIERKGLKIDRGILEKVGVLNNRFICSNAPRKELDYLARRFRFEYLFNEIISCKYPKSDEIRSIAALKETPLDKVVYIGDTVYDYEESTRVSCRFFDVDAFLLLCDSY